MSKEKEGDSFDNTKEKGHRVQPIYHIPLGFGISADKNCADTLRVVPLAFLRSFIAGSFMLFIGKFQGMALPKKKHIPLFLLAGALGYVIYTVAMNTACRHCLPQRAAFWLLHLRL